MEPLSLDAHSPWVNALLACLAGGVVWLAGAKLTKYAGLLSERLGGEQTLIGTLLLGGVVSLPEAATSISAAAFGNAQLAVTTLLGGIAITMVMVAITDATAGGEPLSIDVTQPIVLLQGVLVVVFLSVAAAGIVASDVEVHGVGAWTAALFVLYLVVLVLVQRYKRSVPWAPRRVPGQVLAAGPPAPRGAAPVPPPLGKVLLRVGVSALAVLGAGILLARTADALARQTGLGASWVGLVLGGVATSLPELSTTLAAVRSRHYEMAFADAFGTNLASVALLFFADVAYPGPPILNHAGRFSLFAMLLGIALTAVYLGGLVARRSFTILRMGADSWVVICLYAIGLVFLFRLRSG